MKFLSSIDRQGRYGVHSEVRARGDRSGRARDAIVVTEGGLAAPVEVWIPLMERLADDVDIVATERNGVFRSAHSPGRRVLSRLAGETAMSVRDRAGGRRVLMIAEGFGGLVALETAARYSGLIDALVLVDSLHPEALARSARQRQAMARLEAAMFRSAVRDLLQRRAGGDLFPMLSSEHAAQAAKALRAGQRTHLTALQELQCWKRASPRPTSPRLGSLRLTVLTSEVFYCGDPSQAPMQHALADLSEVSSVVRIPGASALTDPAAMDAIADVVRREVTVGDAPVVEKV